MAENNEDYKNKTGTDLEILQNLEKSYYKNQGQNARRNIKKSMDWFRNRVAKNYKNVRTARMFRDRSLFKDKVTLGKMYFFNYDALHADELPVWDAFPLMIPFDTWRGTDPKTGNSHTYVLGLNFHYLPPVLRMEAFRALLKFRTNKKYNKATRLNFDWQVIMALAQSKYYSHAVHMYRADRFRSKFVEIPAQSFELVLFLPLARWQKGSKMQAWNIK